MKSVKKERRMICGFTCELPIDFHVFSKEPYSPVVCCVGEHGDCPPVDIKETICPGVDKLPGPAAGCCSHCTRFMAATWDQATRSPAPYHLMLHTNTDT